MTKTKNLKYKPYKIISKIELIEDVILFRLEGRLNFSAGQFVQIALSDFGEITVAPTSDPEEKKFFELAIRGCGCTSKKIIEMVPGDDLLLRGPYGNGWPMAKALGKDLILIAGGIGLIPLRPLIFQILKYQREFGKITLIYGTKSEESFLFEQDLTNWRKKITVVPVAEHASPDFWGERGMITEPLKNVALTPDKSIIFICGPEVMCPYCIEILAKKKVSEKNIYISFERRMECGIGVCQHCNIGKYLVCRDGPVFRFDKIKSELSK